MRRRIESGRERLLNCYRRRTKKLSILGAPQTLAMSEAGPYAIA